MQIFVHDFCYNIQSAGRCISIKKNTQSDTDDKNIAENIKFLASCHGFKIRKNLLEQSQKYRKHDTGVNCFYTEFPATCNKTYDQQYDIQNHGDRRQWHRDKVGKHDSKT